MDAAGITTVRAGGVSVVVDTSGGTPRILHWGSDIGTAAGDADSGIAIAMAEAVGHSDFDEPVRVGVWREGARGFLGRPALAGHRDGPHWSPLFEIRSVARAEDSIAVTSADENAGLTVDWRLTVTPQGVLLVDQEVRNSGGTPYVVDDLITWLPLPDQATQVLDFTGRWCRERVPQRQPIAVGTWTREVREGRTGHDGTIVQVALTASTCFGDGEAWSVGLMWSGNTRNLIERRPDGRTAIGAGELLLPGEGRLDPGESYRAPTVAAAYSAAGLDGVTARYVSWLRARPSHPTRSRPRPVTLNVWEAVYFDHETSRLRSLADTAAAIGVERFVLDDGWFRGRRDDRAGLGDWWVDEAVWPDGLGPLVDHVTGLGMEFGLWFEPEMINVDSDLYREHPEWVLSVPGRMPPEWRHQQVLDLGHPAAYAHVRDRMHALLTELDIAYVKWDHNRVIVDGDHLGRAGVHHQALAVYRLIDELKALHPGLEVESCASGGGRVDLGMAQHADRFWASDSNDALDRQAIQRWTGLAIPPEMIGTHIGPPRTHTTGRTHTLSFRAATALFGHAGLEWDITTATAAELELLASWTAFYRANRDLLHGGTVVRVDHPDEAALVHGVVSPDRSRALFAYVQLTMSTHSRPARVRLRGLDESARYRVTQVSPAGPPDTMQIVAPPWLDGVTMTGAALHAIGLAPSILRPENALLIQVDRV